MPIPGMHGMEHVGFTVPDINAACEFFEKILGAQTLYSGGKNLKDDGTWMKDHLNVDPRSTIVEFRYMRCGNGANFEIFQFEAPDQVATPPKNSDIGGYHFAFYVDDMTAAIKFLKENNVQVLGDPTTNSEGPTAGLTWCYFLTPWGQQLEIVSAPSGNAYDREAKARGTTRLFNPKNIAETLIQL